MNMRKLVLVVGAGATFSLATGCMEYRKATFQVKDVKEATHDARGNQITVTHTDGSQSVYKQENND